MGKLTKTLRVASFGLAALLFAALLGLSLPISGWRSFNVQTGSMEPAIETGSLVLVHSVPAADLQPGDVITYINPNDKTQTITHRLTAIQTSKMGSTEYIAKGDANQLPDTPASAGQIVGEVSVIIPFAGHAKNFVLHPAGLLLLIYMPALVIIGQEFRKLSAYYASQKHYRIAGYFGHAKVGAAGHAHILLVIPAVLVAGIIAAVPTFAALKDQVVLTGSSISSVSTPQPPPTNDCTINQTNNVNVTNTNNQSASTGNATNTNNTNGGNATSGSATNSNSSSTTVTVNNSSTCTATSQP